MAPRILTAILLILALALPAAGSTTDDDPQESREKVLVVGDDDERLIVSMDGTELTITTEDGDGTSVRVVDMEQVGMMVGQALEGLDETLAGLADIQLDVHMGHDNRLNLGHHDETWELDLDEIMAQVGAAISVGLEEMDTDDWTSVRVRDRGEEDLREELRELKAELRDLRRQLEARDDD
jgi:hypothetical protein